MYPEWQKTIREAQIKADLEQKRKDEEFEAAKMAIRVQNGQKLKHVLSLFNIEGEPDIDVVTIDNYYFKLYTEGRNGESTYYFYHNEKDGVDTIGFHLLVARILPDDEPDGFEWRDTHGWLNIGRRHVTEEEKQSWYVGLATSIDAIDRAYDEQYPRYLEYKARQNEPIRSQVKHIQDTPMTRLMTALREVISERIKDEMDELIDPPY